MSCCANNCGKPCCDQPAEIHRMKCPNCRLPVYEIWSCADRNCGCLYQIVHRLESIQICSGVRIPCIYVCRACAVELRCISYGRDWVPEGKDRGPALRLFPPGAPFEYLYVAFRRCEYTIRKVLDPRRMWRDGFTNLGFPRPGHKN